MIIMRWLLRFTLAFGAILVIVAYLVVDDFFRNFSDRQVEFDVTDRIASLRSDVDIHLNQIFKSDVVCLWHPDVMATARLHSDFPGKTSLRDNEYEVTNDGPWFHIATIDDDDPIAKILDVDERIIEIESNTACCSRALVARIRDIGNKRRIAVVEAETQCVER